LNQQQQQLPSQGFSTTEALRMFYTAGSFADKQRTALVGTRRPSYQPSPAAPTTPHLDT